MDIIVDPEELLVPFGLDLVLHAREERRVAIISGPNARDAKVKALNVIIQLKRPMLQNQRLSSMRMMQRLSD